MKLKEVGKLLRGKEMGEKRVEYNLAIRSGN